ncbi:MAG: magnesium chelatase, partial [Saprospiraceae bacterium]
VEGQYNVALQLVSQAVREEFLETFPHPEKIKKGKDKDPYGAIRAFFGDSNVIHLTNDAEDKSFHKTLDTVPGMDRLLEAYKIPKSDYYVFKEIVLHSLADLDVLTKELTQGKIGFSDPLGKMLSDLDEEDRD